MNAHLNHMIARQRCAELQREGEQARLARELPQTRCSLRGPHPITAAGTESGEERLRSRPSRRSATHDEEACRDRRGGLRGPGVGSAAL